jgi:pectate lyase
LTPSHDRSYHRGNKSLIRDHCTAGAASFAEATGRIPMRHAAAALLLALLCPALAAAGEFDAASSKASKSSGRALSWSHDLGGGADRVLTVGVTVEDNQEKDPGLSVTFNGVPMSPIPGGLAVLAHHNRALRTQLFYLLEASLPPAGSYPVAVQLARTVHEIGGGAVSLRRLAQRAPEAVVAADSGGSGDVSASIATLTPRAWVVEVVGTDEDVAPTPAAGQTVRVSAVARDAAVAGAARMVETPSIQALAWRGAPTSRTTLVAAAFAPLQYALTTSVTGQGTITPAGGLFSEGATVQLRAEPRATWELEGWSGDASGAASSVSITFDGPKSVAAAFRPDFQLYGWATTNGGTTGGEGGTEVVVDTLAALRFYAAQPGPLVIKVAGTILGNEMVRVTSDKSVLGLGSDARLLGVGLQVGSAAEFGLVHNVVIRNLTLEKAVAPNDGVFITQGATNVWVDHCRFFSDRAHDIDFYDGLLDITNGADFVTVSWSQFSHHFKTSLIGSGDTSTQDPGHLHVTYHHNSFVETEGRNPSIRFGVGHVFNNYYRDIDDYGIASRMGAEVVIENNWFQNVRLPIRADTSLSPIAGAVRGEETNVYVASGPNSITLPPATWVPPYEYGLDPAAAVPDVVAQWGGVGVLTVEGEPPAPSAPTLTVPPASQSVEPGQDVSFFVLADGTWPFTYQWFKDGAPIAGATEPTLSLQDVLVDAAGDYTVQVSNGAGSALSSPATLIIVASPAGGPGVFLRERFVDGSRTNQALPNSSAWFSSSGSSNVTVAGGELKQFVSSSRTIVSYFTDSSGQPATLSVGESITASFNFRVSIVDSTGDNFRVALLRAVANPAAVASAGFVPAGSPNVNARVSGDFGSNASTAFSIYTGYAAFSSLRTDATPPSGVKLFARTLSNSTLIGATGAYGPPLSTSLVVPPAPSAGTLYRGTLKVARTAAGNTISYVMTRVSDGAVLMSHSVLDPNASAVAFDTLAFYVNRNSVNFDFFLSNVDIERTVP